MGSAVIGVLIGLVLIFALFASVVSILTEAVSRLLGLRAEYLLRGLRTLLDSNSKFNLNPFGGTEAPQEAEFNLILARVLAHPLVAATGPGPAGRPEYPAKSPKHEQGSLSRAAAAPVQPTSGTSPAWQPPSNLPTAGNAQLSNMDRRKLPSYLSPRAFARAFIDSVVPDAQGVTTIGKLQALAAKPPEGIPEGMKRAYEVLASALEEAGSDITRVQIALERWYDDHMARVSGWYKRHVRWISLAFSVLLVAALNLSAGRIAGSLYLDQPLRDAVVAQANKAVPCDPGKINDCAQKVRDVLAPLENNGLPIGWTTVERCKAVKDCSWAERVGLADPVRNGGWPDVWHFLGALLGYLVMVVAAVPGARFWFDALSRLNSLRSTGPAPAPAPLPTVVTPPPT